MTHNKIFTEEKYLKLNLETRAVIKDFLNECRVKSLTKKTVSEYENILKYSSMILYKNFENKSILKMSRTDFRDMLLMLQHDLNLSNSRVNSIMSVLTSCLNYIEDDEDQWKDYIKNPLMRMKRLPKKAVREKIFLSRVEVKKIIDRLVANWRLQDAVLISIAYDSGARISELYQIKKTDILLGNTTNEVIRKGQVKKTKLMFMNDTKELIKKWLWLRGDDDIDDLFIYPIFPMASNIHLKKRISLKTLADRITLKGKIIGKHITPHAFRRSRAETLKRGEDERFGGRKFDPREIQILLGHSNLSTTEIYLKDDTEEIIDNILNLMSA